MLKPSALALLLLMTTQSPSYCKGGLRRWRLPGILEALGEKPDTLNGGEMGWFSDNINVEQGLWMHGFRLPASCQAHRSLDLAGMQFPHTSIHPLSSGMQPYHATTSREGSSRPTLKCRMNMTLKTWILPATCAASGTPRPDLRLESWSRTEHNNNHILP